MKQMFILMIAGLMLVGCQKKDQLETTVINAKSMVCDKCSKTIEKAIYKLEGVKEVNVDLNAKTVTVKYVPLQTNLETIEITITDAGYDANNRKRNPEAYNKLDECCKIDG